MSEETKSATAIAPQERAPVTLTDTGLVRLTTVKEALGFAQAALESGLLPPTIKSAQAAFVVMQKGAELGFTPMASFEYIYPVNNRPRLTPAGALAKVQASGQLADYHEEATEQAATVTVVRRGDKRARVTTFTWDDARAAGLTSKDNWTKWRKRMLLARARGFALQDAFADLLGGLPVREQHDLDHGESIGEIPGAKVPAPILPEGLDPLLADDAELP